MTRAAVEGLVQLFAAPIAHRGLHACGAPGPVENSLSAAAAAVAGGYGIECDVRLSRDGEIMVFHDETLDRLTRHRGPVAAYDAAVLTRLQLGGGGDTIPTLIALLGEIAGRAPLVIELKSEGDAAELTRRTLAAIDGYDGVVAIESFDPAVVLRCRRADCSRPIGLVGPPERSGGVEPAALAASDFLSWDIACLDQAAAAERPLSTWTVRTPEQAARASAAGAQIVFEMLRPPGRL